MPPPNPTAFATPADFRAWLERHHERDDELLLRCYKNHAPERGVTYRQALDEALCFGWIDGVRRRLDEDSFSVRFTKRRPKSKWSAVNEKRVAVLEAEGRMRPPGRAAFRAREEQKSTVLYSYESKPLDLDAPYLKKLRASKRARAFWEAQPPGYRRTSAFWVMSAKREETREKRLEVLIGCCERRTTIPLLTRSA